MTPAASSNWSIGSRSASTTMRAGPRRVSWGSSFGPSRRNRSAAALADSPWGTWLLTGRSIPIASGESVMRRVPQDTEAAGVPDDSYALPRSDALIQVKANLASRPGGSGGRAVTGGGRFLGEHEPLVKFRERDFDPDFRHGQDRVASKQGANPALSFACEYRGGRFVLFQHDIALD